MKRFRQKITAKFHHTSLPVLLAACFLLAAVFCFVQNRASSRAQAEELAVELFTTNRQADLDRLTAIGLPAMYEDRFGSRLTEEGAAELSVVGMPYTLLFQQMQSLVERTYVKSVDLEPVKEASQKGQAVYRFRVAVDLYLDRGPAVVGPVVEQTYEGTLTLRKSGLSGWKLDGFTM